jgi:hypothetical protein
VPRRTLLRVVLLLVLHAASRQLDAALGTVLHSSLDLDTPLVDALGFIEPAAFGRAVFTFTAAGLAALALLALLRLWATGEALGVAASRCAEGAWFLLLRPFLTLTAILSVLARPSYPFGFTLGVALTQDLGPAQDLVAAAFALAPLLAALVPRMRIGVPRPWELGFVAFLAYALLSPAWARQWEAHTGNEPKTMRMAVAIGHGLTLDAEGVSAAMEDLEALPFPAALWRAARGTARESLDLVKSLARGPSAVGRDAIRATRISRQTVRGKDGGVFYVLAPGPSALLAPFLRVDRSLNRAAGTPGRLAVTLLAWNALAALLVVGVQLFVRDLTGRAGLAAAAAGGFALLPPFYFYAYQFYPEMLGALALVFLSRSLVAPGPWTTRSGLAFSLLLATLPWLHQKFLPVWAVLALASAGLAWWEGASRKVLFGLAFPQAATLALFALYNFGITGSIRPDALFLAWGPSGVDSSRTLWGVPGLLFDSRYGLLPYAPLYLAAGAGLLAKGEAAAKLRWLLPPVIVYFLTVASADNWSGAGCNLGRYLMPVTPWLVALVAVGLLGMTQRAGSLGLVAALAGLSAAMGLLLGLDPHAANDCSLLLARSAFADGAVYLPTLPLRDWAEAAPGLFWRVATWAAVAAAVAVSLRPGRPGNRPRAMGLGLLVFVLGAGFALERYPSRRTRPLFPDALEIAPGQTVFAKGGARVEAHRLLLEPGDVTLLLRQREPQRLALIVAGEGVLRLRDQRALALRPTGLKLDLEADAPRELQGRKGDLETLGYVRLHLLAREPVAAEIRKD